jgi:hypothetical protein
MAMIWPVVRAGDWTDRRYNVYTRAEDYRPGGRVMVETLIFLLVSILSTLAVIGREIRLPIRAGRRLSRR